MRGAKKREKFTVYTLTWRHKRGEIPGRNDPRETTSDTRCWLRVTNMNKQRQVQHHRKMKARRSLKLRHPENICLSSSSNITSWRAHRTLHDVGAMFFAFEKFVLLLVSELQRRRLRAAKDIKLRVCENHFSFRALSHSSPRQPTVSKKFN